MTTSMSAEPTAHAAAKGRRGVARGVLAILVMAVGVIVIISTFTNNLFRVGPDFESLMGGFRPIIAQQSIDTAKADLAGLSAVGDEFQTKVAPAIAGQLQMTQEQFAGMVSQQFPAVDAGLKAIPQAVPAFNGLLDTLASQRALFNSADAIPTSSLSATTVPWSMLAVGLLTVLIGALIWFKRRTGAMLAVLLGAALIVAPLVLSLPQKASDADQLNANLKPVYTQALVDQSKQTVATIGAMGTEMQSSMLPALATQLKMTPDQLNTFMQAQFPTTAAALASFPTTMQRFQGLVDTFSANLGNYDVLKQVSFVPIIWTLILAGAALVLLGGLALLSGRRAKS